MVKKNLRKITLAATLTALSIVFDIFFNMLVPAGLRFGFPYYAIPLIIGSLVLGPLYGGAMGFLSDLVGFYYRFGGVGYEFMFALQAMMWGIIPALISGRKSRWERVGLAILITHIIASTFSTLGDFYYFYVINQNEFNTAFQAALVNVPLRLYMMPVNVIMMTAITYQVNVRLEPIYEVFLDQRPLKTRYE